MQSTDRDNSRGKYNKVTPKEEKGQDKYIQSLEKRVEQLESAIAKKTKRP